MIIRGYALISAIRRPRFLAIALSLSAHSAVAAAGYAYVSWKVAPIVDAISVEVIALPTGPSTGVTAANILHALPSRHTQQQPPSTPKTGPELVPKGPMPTTRSGVTLRTVITDRQSLEPQAANITPIDPLQPAEVASTPDPKSVALPIPADPSADKSAAAMAIDAPISTHLNAPSPQVPIAVPDSTGHLPLPRIIAKLNPPRPIAGLHSKANAAAPLSFYLQEIEQTPAQPNIRPPLPLPRPSELRITTLGPQQTQRELPLPPIRPLASRVEAAPSRNQAPFAPKPALQTATSTPVSATANPLPKSGSPPPPAIIMAARSSTATARVSPPAWVGDSSPITSVGRTLRPRPGNRPPIYPRVARERGWEGRVVLGVAVDPTGAIAGVEITETSGYRVLDQAALSAVRHWRFADGDDSVPSRDTVVRVPITFKLRD